MGRIQGDAAHRLGAMISWHRRLDLAKAAQRRVHRKALYGLRTQVVTLHFIPGRDQYVATEYCNGYRPQVVAGAQSVKEVK